MPRPLWKRKALLSPEKGGGKWGTKAYSFDANCFVEYLRWDSKLEKQERGSLEEFVIEGHNFTQPKCLENVNTANLRSPWSGMKASAASTQQRFPRRAMPPPENPALTVRWRRPWWAFRHNRLKGVRTVPHTCFLGRTIKYLQGMARTPVYMQGDLTQPDSGPARFILLFLICNTFLWFASWNFHEGILHKKIEVIA